MKIFWQILFSLILLIFDAFAWKIHFRGRSKGGNLGVPDVEIDTKLLPPDQWFSQHLDHFNPSDNRTWKQRYFVNDTFYKEGGPVFLMIGGEGKASPIWMLEGTWIQYAKKFNGLCFQLEHRYYGDSHPTGDLSVKNLQYLSSEQALADLANFISEMNIKYNLNPNNKWISFGGSYPGSLAAWLRLKYPHLVHGSVSSSGPLLAIADFKDYYLVVRNAIQSTSEKCLKSLSAAQTQFNSFMSHRVGQQGIFKLFKLCDKIDPDIKSDVANLYESIASIFAGIVQYNKDNRKFEGVKGSDLTIDTICDVMNNESLGVELHRLAELNKIVLNAYDEKCLDYKYDKMIRELSEVSWDSEQSEGGRQWTYQTCTEFGFFQSSDSDKTQMLFSNLFPVEFFIQQCSDIFGSKFDGALLQHGVDRTNMMYGALDLHVSNVVFVQGSVDPWHALGITKTLNHQSPAIYIEGTAHCANMYPSSPDDLPHLKLAREEIETLLFSWLR